MSKQTGQVEEDWLDEREKHRQLALDKNYEFSTDYGFYDPVMCGSIDGTDEKAHDRSIIRAIWSRYEPNLGVKSDPERTLFVGRVDYGTTEAELAAVFGKFGDIKSLRLVRDVVTGCSKGYAFVEYKHRRDARYAHKKAFKLVVDGRELVVEHERERMLKGWRPRRLGGGFGGYKESGQMKFGGRYKPFDRIFRPYHSNQRQYSFNK